MAKKKVVAKKACKSSCKKTMKPAKKAVAKTPVKKAAKKGVKKVEKKKATKKTAGTRKPNAAFMKPLKPSDALAKIVGSSPLPRTEVVKKLWEYIKKHNLQDANDKKKINADEALKVVFNGQKTVDMFKMTKLVSEHLS